MDDVERQLRDVLTRHAQAAPEGHLMLPRVRRAAARRRRRRALLGGAAAVLALVALGTAVLAGRLAVPGAALQLGTTPSAAGVGPGVDFVAGAPVDVTFPFAPRMPLVAGTLPRLMLVAGRPTLQYLPADPPPSRTPPPAAPSTSASEAASAAVAAKALRSALSSGGVPTVGIPPGAASPGDVPPGKVPPGDVPPGKVRPGKVPPSDVLPGGVAYGGLPYDPVTVVTAGAPWTGGPFTPSSGARQITVDGLPAILGERTSAGVTDHVLSWARRPGLWVGISAPDVIPTDRLIKYATSLPETPTTQPGPFDFDLVPAGYSVDNISSSTVTFAPPGTAPSADFAGKLVVMAEAGQPAPGTGLPVSVGGRAGRLNTTGNVTMLQVDEGGGWALTVQLPARLGIAGPDLLRFAAGVHLTAQATPARG